MDKPKSDVCGWARILTSKNITKCEKCEINDCCPVDELNDIHEDNETRMLSVIERCIDGRRTDK